MGYIAGHILHQNFYDQMEMFLCDMGQRTIDCQVIFNGINKLLIDANLLHDGKVAVNHSIPQEIIERAHDELLDAIDDRLFHLAHLLKIASYIPTIIDRLGPIYRYEDPNTQPIDILDTELNMPEGEWREGVFCVYDFETAVEVKKERAKIEMENEAQPVHFWQINLENYCDPNTSWHEIGVVLDKAYPLIATLRLLMNQQTLKSRRDNIYRDSFCGMFLDGRETETTDVPSRMEYQYFLKAGVPLAFPEASQDVQDWIQDLQNTEIPDAPRISGIVPQSEVLNYYVSKPPKSRHKPPRLVYQSPR